MSRLNPLLFLGLLLLAIAVVHTQHRSRRLFIDLQKEKDRTEQQIAEWHQLQIEQGLLTSSHRVEEGAISVLQMQLPKGPQSRLVVLGESPNQVAAVPDPANSAAQNASATPDAPGAASAESVLGASAPVSADSASPGVTTPPAPTPRASTTLGQGLQARGVLTLAAVANPEMTSSNAVSAHGQPDSNAASAHGLSDPARTSGANALGMGPAVNAIPRGAR